MLRAERKGVYNQLDGSIRSRARRAGLQQIVESRHKLDKDRVGSRLQQDLLSPGISRSKLRFIKKTQFIVQRVCVWGNAINPEIMNHLESGVGAHFDQILGRFHKMEGGGLARGSAAG